MVKRNPYANRKTKHLSKRSHSDGPVREAPVYVAKEAVVYGQPFIVMEDGDKNTFCYNGSAWVAYSMTMAECRLECQVKSLPQKVNGKVRYEVREPIRKH